MASSAANIATQFNAAFLIGAIVLSARYQDPAEDYALQAEMLFTGVPPELRNENEVRLRRAVLAGSPLPLLWSCARMTWVGGD